MAVIYWIDSTKTYVFFRSWFWVSFSSGSRIRRLGVLLGSNNRNAQGNQDDELKLKHFIKLIQKLLDIEVGDVFDTFIVVLVRSGLDCSTKELMIRNGSASPLYTRLAIRTRNRAMDGQLGLSGSPTPWEWEIIAVITPLASALGTQQRRVFFPVTATSLSRSRPFTFQFANYPIWFAGLQ